MSGSSGKKKKEKSPKTKYRNVRKKQHNQSELTTKENIFSCFIWVFFFLSLQGVLVVFKVVRLLITLKDNAISADAYRNSTVSTLCLLIAHFLTFFTFHALLSSSLFRPQFKYLLTSLSSHFSVCLICLSVNLAWFHYFYLQNPEA